MGDWVRALGRGGVGGLYTTFPKFKFSGGDGDLDSGDTSSQINSGGDGNLRFDLFPGSRDRIRDQRGIIRGLKNVLNTMVFAWYPDVKHHVQAFTYKSVYLKKHYFVIFNTQSNPALRYQYCNT